MVSDSAIQLIIGNKIIIIILKPILLLSIVKLLQVKPEYIQIQINHANNGKIKKYQLIYQ